MGTVHDEAVVYLLRIQKYTLLAYNFQARRAVEHLSKIAFMMTMQSIACGRSPRAPLPCGRPDRGVVGMGLRSNRES